MISLCVLSYVSEMRENFRVSLDIMRQLSNSFAMDRQGWFSIPRTGLQWLPGTISPLLSLFTVLLGSQGLMVLC